MNRCLAGAAFVAASALASEAGAVEREHRVGIDVGGAMLVVNDKTSTDVGFVAGAHWSYGVSDAFNLMAEGAWSLVAPGERAQNAQTPRTRPSWVANADVGVAYVFDVLRWVPYAGILAGAYPLSGGTIARTKVLAGAAIALGLDYRFGRTWSAGIAFRQHMVVDAATYPSFTQLFARLEYAWGW